MLFACTREPQFRCVTYYRPIVYKPRYFYSEKLVNRIDTVFIDGQKVVAYTTCGMNSY